MANNYLQFSDAIGNITEEEEVWWKDQTKEIYVEGLSFDIPKALADFPDLDGDNSLGFEWSFNERDRSLWLYADESGEPERLAFIVQKFLRKFRPDTHWSLSFSYSCDKMRYDEFGGGAVFVTADEIRYFSSHDFLSECRNQFEEKSKPKGS